jgi:hypothetical protein
MRRRGWSAFVGAGLVVVLAAPVASQGAPPRAPKPPSRVSDSAVVVADSYRVRLDTLRNRYFFSRDSLQSIMAQAFAVRRVRIGVVVRGWPSETDSIGALIDAVTPGGPAATAGILAGDIVTRFNGTPLAVSLTDVAPGTKVSSPGLRFAELVAKLPPDDTVVVEYRRGRVRRSTRVVTAADPENITVTLGPDGGYGFRALPGGAEYWVGGGDSGDERALELAKRRSELARGMPPGRMAPSAFAMAGPLLDLELAPVNPQLGSYFGTTEGVLVVDAPDPAPLGLRAGDVVLNVDGRTVSNPRQLIRILGSYEPDEAIEMQVMRQKKRVTLKGTLGR